MSATVQGIGPVITPAGMRMVRSAHGPPDTADRLADAIRARGMTVFARIDHAAAAKAEGLSLRPTELLIFGNARAGTPLMQAAQTTGIDLPLRALIWLDADGTTWLGYNDPDWFAARHGAVTQSASVLHVMQAALSDIAAAATGHADTAG